MLGLYRRLSWAGSPLIHVWLRMRAKAGREDLPRLGERRGVASTARPPGPLIWVHGASVGEATSALGLIERLHCARPEVTVLVTSGTVTAAEVLVKRLPPGVIHQYVPVDAPAFVRRFLGHWRPDLALWLESELWPNLLTMTKDAGARIVLVNGRLSARSFRRWRLVPAAIGRLLRCFDLCIAQSKLDAARLQALGAGRVVYHGNLKQAALPLPHDEASLQALRQAIGTRPVWLAASTHPGEEELIADAHRRLHRAHPDLLTIIAPRHISRGNEIARRLRPLGSSRRSEGLLPDDATEIYLADTMGELGVLYRSAPIVLVGGSLVPHGGHNPLEPARLGCAVLHGPHMHNFAEIAAEMDAAGAAQAVSNAEELTAAVEALLADAGRREDLSAEGLAYVEAHADVLDAVFRELKPFLDAPKAASRACA